MPTHTLTQLFLEAADQRSQLKKSVLTVSSMKFQQHLQHLQREKEEEARRGDQW